ncbi:hypothetical protein L1987_68565 [Smallanthus sonchifolius]|uniref:Uncharacterized protein n=1 Tax=Smallanthus sonchifolius TaxID=185202 RepID=A0ACB9B413_9ASTR|nr:hypothetical protein L1987_68565 [Smallanthus sonchifolius]
MIDDFDVAATELYRERFIKAFAHDLQVSLLILDSSVLAPYKFLVKKIRRTNQTKNMENQVKNYFLIKN